MLGFSALSVTPLSTLEDAGIIRSSSISSMETFGTAVIQNVVFNISPNSISSEEAFGQNSVGFPLALTDVWIVRFR